MEPKNRQKTLLIVVIVIVVLLAGDKVVVGPLLAAWNRGAAKVTQLKKDYNEGSQTLKSKKSILAKWQQMKTAATPQDRTTEDNRILAAYDKWEKAARVKPERINRTWRDGEEHSEPSGKAGGLQWETWKQYATFEFSADVSGNMPQLESFLYAVERDLAELALKVEGVKLSARGDDGLQLSLSLQLSGLVLGQSSPNN